MSSLIVTLPESLKSFIDARVAEGGFASVDEYVSGLIQADQDREDWRRVEGLLLEGINSGSFEIDPEEYWETKRRKIIEKYGDVTGQAS